jgi:low molecular weight protein-tyrosine phosphatase
MSFILVVCTGNVCRSPVAEGFLRERLATRFPEGPPDVSSVGLAGWEGSPAHPDSVAAAAEHGVDISAHVARRVRPEELEDAALIIAMAAEHRDGVARLLPRAGPRTFTLKELVRLLEALPPVDGRGPFDPEALDRRLRDAQALREGGFAGNIWDEDVADPLGMPMETFRAVAWELEDWSTRLVRGLFGRVPVPASAGGRGE